MQASVVLSVFLAFLFIGPIFAQAVGNCDPFDALPPAALNTLLQRIQERSFSSDKLKVLSAFVATNAFGLSGKATTSILAEFTFSSDQVKALDMIKKFILGLTCAEAVTIIDSYTFSRDKMVALAAIVNYIMDLQKNGQMVINAFTFSSDKAAAKKLMDDAKVRSCLWGEIVLDRFDFIIDTSGSMGTRFTTPTGETLTRLEFVQRELYRVMNNSLSSNQKFNIISFSERANAWKPGVVPATPANIASASAFVRGLQADGGTYVMNALQLSMSDKEVKGVYLLSDGEPTDDPQRTISSARSWGYPVNTISFKAGDAGVQFLLHLANATHGTFRAFK